MGLRDLRVDMRAIIDARQRSNDDPVDEEDLREALQAALEGRGAFGRFRATIGRFPDLREQWETAEWNGNAREAELWLESLGVRAIYDPPATVRPESEQGSPKREGEKLGFLDVLLLGAPDGKTELLDGKVIRRIIARDSSQARAIFKTIAREMTEIHGIGWRKRLIEGKSMYEVDRYKLFVDQARVELEVAVTPALWRAFAGGAS